jgi:hypothetical protein
VTWTIIQVSLILIFLVFALWHHARYGWQGGVLFSSEDNFKLLFYHVLPQAVAISSVLLGLFYLLLSPFYTFLHCLFFFYIPLFYLLGFWTIIGFKIGKEVKLDRKSNLQQVAISKWIEQFDFLNKQDVIRSEWSSRGIVHGHLFLEVDKENAHLLEEKKQELPETLHVKIRARSDNEQAFVHLVRKWVKELDFVEEKNIEEWTHFNEDVEQYQGNIYIVTDPENFPQIEERAKALPKNIHFTLCKHRHLIHSLWSSIQNNKEYLDEHYKGEYYIFQTS